MTFFDSIVLETHLVAQVDIEILTLSSGLVDLCLILYELCLDKLDLAFCRLGSQIQ